MASGMSSSSRLLTVPGSIVAIVWSSSTTGVPEPLSAGASIRSPP